MYDQAPGNGSGYVLKNERPFFVKFGDGIIDAIRRALTKSMFETCAFFFAWAGYVAVFVSAFLILIGQAVIASKGGGASEIFKGMLMAVGIGISQYVAGKFLVANEVLIDTSPSKISSLAFTDCLTLSSIAGAIVLFFGALIMMFTGIVSFLGGWGGTPTQTAVGFLSGSVLCLFAAILCLNPDTISIEIGPKTTAGEEAIGIVYFFLKLGMKLVPFLFGIVCVAAAVATLVGVVELFKDSTRAFDEAQKAVSAGLMIPFGAYGIFLFLALFLELIKSVVGLQWLTQNK